MATRQTKSTNYFSHDSNARNDEKLVRLRMKQGAAGYGVYFMILERLREEADYMSAKDYNMIAFDLRVDAAIVKSVVEDFGLFTFTDDGKCFYSESFTRRMYVMEEARTRRSVAGKKGGAPIGNSNARKKDLPKTDVEVSSTLAPAGQADDDKFLTKFFRKSNQTNIEALMMNFRMKPDELPKLRQIAGEVVAEWKMSEKHHNDYTDWSRHLIATMRIKVKDRQQAKGKTAINETEPPTSADYQFDGGFGSKDV